MEVESLFDRYVGETVYNIDDPVRNYLVNILEAQTSLDTSCEQTEVVQTLGMFLHTCGCCESVESAREVVSNILQEMENRGLVPKPEPVSNTRLQAPVQLGKIYERTLKEAQNFGVQTTFSANTVDVNTNEDLDWEEKRELAKSERRRRKEDEKKQQMKNEFDEYLERRGISSADSAVKIHPGKGEWKGSADVRCDNIHINMGKQVLLDKTDLIIHSSRRYGLVGRNGVGKTTLLRYFAEGELEGVSPYLQILHIEQEYNGDDRTALQAVLDTDVERNALLQEEEDLLNSEGKDISQRLSEIYERMDEIDAHGAEAKAFSILNGLSFTHEMVHTATKCFSGGWRMRISLARALYISPEVLLLDEPTNHLDLHAVLWLEHTLINWPKTLVVVSHSRSFLNAVATDIIHYANQKLTYYKGNYDWFEKTRYENLKNQQKSHEAQEKARKHMQEFVDRWRFNAKKAKMAQSRMKAIEKMDLIAAVEDDPSFCFTIPEPEPCPPPYMQIIDVTFGYSKDKILFRDVNFGIDNDSRICLVGDNGSGKSTFMNVMADDLTPISGRVIKNGKCRVARFTQHHMDSLKLQMTALEFMKSMFAGKEEGELRAQLGRFGLSGEKATQPMYTLSGGQKSRVSFAYLTFNKPHLLLLDEPTNHLDIDTVDAVISALHMYSGGVVIISHDEHLINSVCSEIWVAGGGQLVKYEGTFSDYKKGLIKNMTGTKTK